MSSGGGPTSSTVTQTTVPEYLRPYVEEMAGQARGLAQYEIETGYKPYYGQRFAGFTPFQAQAFQNLEGIQTPQQQTDASNIAFRAGQIGLGTAQDTSQQLMGSAQQFGQQGAGFGGQAAGLAPAAQQFGQQGAGFGGQAANLGIQGAQAAQQSGLAAQQAAGQFGAQGAQAGQTGLNYATQGMQQAQQSGLAAQQAAGQFGAQGAQAGQAGMGYGAQGAQMAAGTAGAAGAGAQQFGGLGAQFGSQGAQQAAMAAQGAQGAAGMYGGMGAGFGTSGANIASQAQRAAEGQADLYGQLGAGFGAQATGMSPLAQQYGAQGAGFGAQAAGMAGMGYGAGQQYAQQATSPEAMQAYMSPYMQNVVDVQQREARRAADIQRQQNQATATQQGAFGGSRQAIVESELQRNLGTQLGDIQATGLQSAFANAQQAQQFGAGLGLQGLQAGTQAQQAGIQGAQAGLQGVGQAADLYGLGMQGAGLGLQGTGQRLAAGQLGLAGTAQGMQGAGIGLQGVGQQLAAGQLGLQGAQTGISGAQAGLQGIGQQISAGQLGLAGTAQGIAGAQTGIAGAGMGLQGVGQQIAGGQLGLAGTAQGVQGAQTAMQGAQTGLQGVGQQIAGGQLGLAGTAQGISGQQAGMQGAQTGLQGLQQAGQLYGLGMQGAQTGLQGVQGAISAGQYGLGGLGAAQGAAGQLGQLGAQQFEQQMGLTDAMQKYGALQQQMQQQALDYDYQQYIAEQNLPYQQLGYFSDMIRGLPLSQSSQQVYGGQPDIASQLGGLAMAGYGMFGRKEGGQIKKYQEGGQVKSYQQGGGVTGEGLNLESVGALPGRLRRLSDSQLAAYARTVKDAITLSAIQSELERRAKMRQPYEQGPEATTAQMIAQQAEAASIGQPRVGMAGGGIVALQAGGGVMDRIRGFLSPQPVGSAPSDEDLQRRMGIVTSPQSGTPPAPSAPPPSAPPSPLNNWSAITNALKPREPENKALFSYTQPPGAKPSDSSAKPYMDTEGGVGQGLTADSGVGLEQLRDRGQQPPQMAPAGRGSSLGATFEEFRKMIPKGEMSPEQRTILDDMQSRISKQIDEAKGEKDTAKFDAIMLAGLAMMGGNSLADGLARAAQTGGATYMAGKKEARKALNAAENAELAFRQYELSVMKGNDKEAQGEFDTFLNWTAKMAQVDATNARTSALSGSEKGLDAQYRLLTSAITDVESKIGRSPKYQEIGILQKQKQEMGGKLPQAQQNRLDELLIDFNAEVQNARRPLQERSDAILDKLTGGDTGGFKVTKKS